MIAKALKWFYLVGGMLLSAGVVAHPCTNYLQTGPWSWPLPGASVELSAHVYRQALLEEVQAIVNHQTLAELAAAYKAIPTIADLAYAWQIRQGMQQYYTYLDQQEPPAGRDYSFYADDVQQVLAARHLAAYRGHFQRLRNLLQEAQLPWQQETVDTPWGPRLGLVLSLATGPGIAPKGQAALAGEETMAGVNYLRQAIEQFWQTSALPQASLKLVYMDLQIPYVESTQRFSLAQANLVGAMRRGDLIFLPSEIFGDPVLSIPRAMHELIHYRTAWARPYAAIKDSSLARPENLSYSRELSFSEIDAWQETYAFTRTWGLNLLKTVEDPLELENLRAKLNFHLTQMRQQWPKVADLLARHLAAVENTLQRHDYLDYMAITFVPLDQVTAFLAKTSSAQAWQAQVYYPLAAAATGPQAIYRWEQNIYHPEEVVPTEASGEMEGNYLDGLRAQLRPFLLQTVAAEKARLQRAETFFAASATDQF